MGIIEKLRARTLCTDVDDAADVLEFLFEQFETFIDRAGNKRYQWRGPDFGIKAHGPTIEEAIYAAMKAKKE